MVAQGRLVGKGLCRNMTFLFTRRFFGEVGFGDGDDRREKSDYGLL